MAKSQSILGKKRDSSKIRPSGEGPVSLSQEAFKLRNPMANQKLYPNGPGIAGDEGIYQKGGKIRPSFEEWYKTVPEYKSDTSHYDLRRAYDLAPQKDLDRFVNDPEAHMRSVYFDPKTKVYNFVKSKDHPTLNLELEWYNSNDPEAVKFRNKYSLDTTGDYYKYVPKKEAGGTVQVLDTKVVNGKKMYLVEGNTIKAQDGVNVPLMGKIYDAVVKGSPAKDATDLYNKFEDIVKKRKEFNKKNKLPENQMTPEEIQFRERLYRTTPVFTYPGSVNEDIVNNRYKPHSFLQIPKDFEKNYNSEEEFKKFMEKNYPDLLENSGLDIDKRQELKRMWFGLPKDRPENWVKSTYTPSSSSPESVYYMPKDIKTLDKKDFDYIYNLVESTRRKDKTFPGGNSSVLSMHRENPYKSYDKKFKSIQEFFKKSGGANQLGNFKLGTGKDEKGRYISIYDKWDLEPPALKDKGIDIQHLGNAPEIYYRMYYTPQDEAAEKIVNRKSNKKSDYSQKEVRKGALTETPYQDGGVIQDDRGQWAHPGEVTKINSPYITMYGVPYPVLGISDTGHQQLMMPGHDYSYYGKSVTEYPIVAEQGYEIKKGDNLTKIAKKFGITINDILEANKEIKDPDKIYHGKTLVIPSTGKSTAKEDASAYEANQLESAPTPKIQEKKTAPTTKKAQEVSEKPRNIFDFSQQAPSAPAPVWQQFLPKEDKKVFTVDKSDKKQSSTNKPKPVIDYENIGNTKFIEDIKNLKDQKVKTPTSKKNVTLPPTGTYIIPKQYTPSDNTQVAINQLPVEFVEQLKNKNQYTPFKLEDVVSIAKSIQPKTTNFRGNVQNEELANQLEMYTTPNTKTKVADRQLVKGEPAFKNTLTKEEKELLKKTITENIQGINPTDNLKTNPVTKFSLKALKNEGDKLKKALDESKISTKALRGILSFGMPSNAAQLIAAMITKDPNLSLNDVSEEERLALFNSIMNANIRNKNASGMQGTQYVDYSPEMHEAIQRLQGSVPQVLAGSYFSPDFNAATKFGRVSYEMNPDSTIDVYDRYDFSKTKKLESAYSKLRNLVGDAAVKRGIESENGENYVGNFDINKMRELQKQYANATGNPTLSFSQIYNMGRKPVKVLKEKIVNGKKQYLVDIKD